ncbi:TlpA disulfide reductase family protein [Bacillus sp. FJAT-47783]|uniref:TlpA family protein disulfide reductase n=1 Tax=Bacillus sp. FJAT-47783 TaxID=2922712 RepID=UPI001FAD744F|nr:TlpA disulfide reductase family protein [Bacillus sp. FJAT-47783]
MKRIIAIIVLVVLASVAIWQTLAHNETKEGLEKGALAPDFEVQTLEGEIAHLSDFRGKKVILNFWATWCPPCKEEMPEMQKFHEKFGDQVAVIGVNFTVSEKSEENVRTFVEENEYTFPILLDQKNKANSGYEVLSYPTSYFLDEEGRIIDKIVGPMTYKVMIEKTGM